MNAKEMIQNAVNAAIANGAEVIVEQRIGDVKPRPQDLDPNDAAEYDVPVRDDESGETDDGWPVGSEYSDDAGYADEGFGDSDDDYLMGAE